MTAAQPLGIILQLRPGVTLVNRAGRQHILVSPEGNAVRVSPLAAELMPMLSRGSSLEELLSAIQRERPGAPEAEAVLGRFLEILRHAGLLGRPQVTHRQRSNSYAFLNIDPFALTVTKAAQTLPRSLVWLTLLLLAFLALAPVAGLFHSGFRIRPEMVLWLFNPIGILCFFLVSVPAHELAHALACRAFGAPVRAAGVILFAHFLPVPFVDPSYAYRIERRLPRAAIAAAGPFVDLLTCGVGAWFVSPAHHSLAFAGAGHTLFLLGLAFVFFDTTPFTPSDGSHVLEALLNDERARQDALSSPAVNPRPSLRKYRLACGVHTALALSLFWLITTR